MPGRSMPGSVRSLIVVAATAGPQAVFLGAGVLALLGLAVVALGFALPWMSLILSPVFRVYARYLDWAAAHWDARRPVRRAAPEPRVRGADRYRLVGRRSGHTP